jgi:hypothetical protein
MLLLATLIESLCDAWILSVLAIDVVDEIGRRFSWDFETKGNPHAHRVLTTLVTEPSLLSALIENLLLATLVNEAEMLQLSQARGI